ncbi:hypothetical protein AB205_0177790, partial [Aquarana catesbeiana]
ASVLSLVPSAGNVLLKKKPLLYTRELTQCGKCFVQKEHLRQHQKSHTGACPYSCSECGKCFIQNEALLIHQRVHTGERPYSCSEVREMFYSEGRTCCSPEKSHGGAALSVFRSVGNLSLRKDNLLYTRDFTRESVLFRVQRAGSRSMKKETFLNTRELTWVNVPIDVQSAGKLLFKKENLTTT